MIAGRADGANVNDLVTVRPLTRPGTSPRWGRVGGTHCCAPPPSEPDLPAFQASGSSKPRGRQRASALASWLVVLGGGEPPLTVGVKEPVEGPVLAVDLLDDVLLAQDPPNGHEPLLPLE